MHDQREILSAIMRLHNKGFVFQLDPMYNQGTMYPAGALPEYRFDIKPRVPGVVAADARALPLAGSCISSMVLDPPWLIHAAGGDKMTDRFGSLPTKQALIDLTSSLLREGYRVLMQDGLLVFKCQDFIHDRRKFFFSLIVQNYALELGFNPIDHFILLAKSRMRDTRDRCISYASHSWHTHFFVFRKKRSRTPYRSARAPGVVHDRSCIQDPV